MNNAKYVAGSLAVLLMMAGAARAQEKADATGPIPLHVAIVFNEYDAGKKISTLPYEMACNATTQGSNGSSLRLGLRVPIKVGGKDSTQTTYQDVGTDIDCSAKPASDAGRFLIDLGLKRNLIYPPNESSTPVEWRPGAPLQDQPIFGGFDARVRNLVLRDGETVLAATATDPVSGHVWKIDVSLKTGK